MNQSAGSRLLPNNWWQQSLSDIAMLAPVHTLLLPFCEQAGVTLAVKREDLLCPFLGGNKFYKLYYHLHRALACKAQCLVTFGGAFSNHLYALARAGYELGLSTVGVVRGERPAVLSPTLQDCETLGMTLFFVSREQYKQKQFGPLSSLVESLAGQRLDQASAHMVKSGVYVIPEGGGDCRGAFGMMQYSQALAALFKAYDHIVIPCGTGASVAGLAAGAPSNVTVHGIMALKGSRAMVAKYTRHIERTRHHLSRSVNSGAQLIVHDRFHQGGYGPIKPLQMEHLKKLLSVIHLPLDPVYTAKMLLGLEVLVQERHIAPGDKVLMIHSGGLQGARKLSISD